MIIVLFRSVSADAANSDATARDHATSSHVARRGDDPAERRSMEAVPSNWHGNDHHQEWQVGLEQREKIFDDENDEKPRVGESRDIQTLEIGNKHRCSDALART